MTGYVTDRPESCTVGADMQQKLCRFPVQPDIVDGMEAPWTERRVLDVVAARHSGYARGGPEWTWAEQVREPSGRICDAMALANQGQQLHGFEVKVSRADWLRELARPEKAAPFMALVDRWWLVCPHGVALPSELPPGWGMLLAHPTPDRLTTVVPAPVLPGVRQVPIFWLASFTRAAVRTVQDRARPPVQPVLL